MFGCIIKCEVSNERNIFSWFSKGKTKWTGLATKIQSYINRKVIGWTDWVNSLKLFNILLHRHLQQLWPQIWWPWSRSEQPRYKYAFGWIRQLYSILTYHKNEQFIFPVSKFLVLVVFLKDNYNVRKQPFYGLMSTWVKMFTGYILYTSKRHCKHLNTQVLQECRSS